MPVEFYVVYLCGNLMYNKYFVKVRQDVVFALSGEITATGCG